jgi:hypothetical protein
MPFYTEKLPGNYAIARTIYERCYRPRRCYYSGKWLFLRKAYCLEFYSFMKPAGILREPPVEFYTWVDRDTYITMKLKGEL